MRSVRRAGAVVSGILLYSAALGVGGFLDDLRLPRAVYALLGGRGSVAVLVSEAVAIALLLALLALGWSYLTIRPRGPLRRGHRPTTGWCIGGVGLGWLGWMIYGAISLSFTPTLYSQPLLHLMLSSSTPPLWGLLNIVGVLAGVWYCGVLARRQRQAQRRLQDQSAPAPHPA